MLSKLSGFLRRFPLKLMVVAIFLSFVDVRNPPFSVKLGYAEFYPFSCFPMFSTFSPYGNYVYITDANDEPLPLLPTFKVTCGAMTKSYRNFIKNLRNDIGGKLADLTAEQKRPAGDAFLIELRNDVAPHAFETGSLPHLRLYEVILFRDASGKIIREKYLVGELKENDA